MFLANHFLFAMHFAVTISPCVCPKKVTINSLTTPFDRVALSMQFRKGKQKIENIEIRTLCFDNVVLSLDKVKCNKNIPYHKIIILTRQFSCFGQRGLFSFTRLKITVSIGNINQYIFASSFRK